MKWRAPITGSRIRLGLVGALFTGWLGQRQQVEATIMMDKPSGRTAQSALARLQAKGAQFVQKCTKY
jgi:hypothetical protein